MQLKSAKRLLQRVCLVCRYMFVCSKRVWVATSQSADELVMTSCKLWTVCLHLPFQSFVQHALAQDILGKCDIVKLQSSMEVCMWVAKSKSPLALAGWTLSRDVWLKEPIWLVKACAICLYIHTYVQAAAHEMLMCLYRLYRGALQRRVHVSYRVML